MKEIRFDDIPALSALVSDKLSEFGPPFEITQDMIDRFAELTGDHQWIHIDVERAKRESPFGTPIAHGFLTLSLIPQLRPRTEHVVVGHGSAVNYGANKLRFVNPVPAGSKVHARMRLVSVESKARGTIVTQEIQINVVGQDTLAVVYEMLVLYNPPR